MPVCLQCSRGHAVTLAGISSITAAVSVLISRVAGAIHNPLHSVQCMQSLYYQALAPYVCSRKLATSEIPNDGFITHLHGAS